HSARCAWRRDVCTCDGGAVEMLERLSSLFSKQSSQPAKKHEWSIADDMPIRSRYARETGAACIYITREEYRDLLMCAETFWNIPPLDKLISDYSRKHWGGLFVFCWDGIP